MLGTLPPEPPPPSAIAGFSCQQLLRISPGLALPWISGSTLYTCTAIPQLQTSFPSYGNNKGSQSLAKLTGAWLHEGYRPLGQVLSGQLIWGIPQFLVAFPLDRASTFLASSNVARLGQFQGPSQMPSPSWEEFKKGHYFCWASDGYMHSTGQIASVSCPLNWQNCKTILVNQISLRLYGVCFPLLV